MFWNVMPEQLLVFGVVLASSLEAERCRQAS
jgi:hypothetical protein